MILQLSQMYSSGLNWWYDDMDNVSARELLNIWPWIIFPLRLDINGQISVIIDSPYISLRQVFIHWCLNLNTALNQLHSRPDCQSGQGSILPKIVSITLLLREWRAIGMLWGYYQEVIKMLWRLLLPDLSLFIAWTV